MNWDDAMRAMRDGSQVRQVSAAVRTFNGARNEFNVGVEPIKFWPAYTEFGLPHRVLVGAWSGNPVIPNKAMREATDWIALPKCEVPT